MAMQQTTVVTDRLVLARPPYLAKTTLKKSMIGKGNAKCVEAHIARCGTFKGYRDGEFTLSRKDFDKMIYNFQSEKNPLPVYFGHSDVMSSVQEPDAKGWILGLTRRGDNLWAHVEMTEEMETAIKKGGFRFTSIYCRMEDCHRETGKKIGARLVSLAITNSPFIDGLEPLSLSLTNVGTLSTYLGKDIMKMSETNKLAKKILSALQLSEDKLQALEAILQEGEVPAAEGEGAPAPEGEGEAPEVDMAKLEELRAMASEITGEELDMEGLLALLEEHLKMMAEQMAGEEMAAKANANTPLKPDAVTPVAPALSNHPALLALTKELNDAKASLAVLLNEKKATEAKEREGLVLKAIEEGKILESNKDHWLKAMEMDKDLALTLMGSSKAVPMGTVVKPHQNDGKKTSEKVLALSDHEKRILAGASRNKH